MTPGFLAIGAKTVARVPAFVNRPRDRASMWSEVFFVVFVRFRFFDALEKRTCFAARNMRIRRHARQTSFARGAMAIARAAARVPSRTR